MVTKVRCRCSASVRENERECVGLTQSNALHDPSAPSFAVGSHGPIEIELGVLGLATREEEEALARQGPVLLTGGAVVG